MTISYREYKVIFDRFSPYIDYIYFSVPGDVYQSRRNIFNGYSFDEATKKLSACLNLASTYGIKKELALNTYRLDDKCIEQAYNYCYRLFNGSPDAVVSLVEYGNKIRDIFGNPVQIVSFNSSVRKPNDIEKIPDCFSEIVFGGPNIRDNEIWSYTKIKGFQPRLLLNNGCSFNCGGCKKANICKRVFETNLSEYGIDRLYAMQSIIPSEFNEYIEKNDTLCGYKISSRNCSFDYLIACLSGYIENKENISMYHNFYHLWCRLAHFQPFYQDINFSKVKSVKDMLWSK